MDEPIKYTCPCCGYKTLDEEPPGTYDICHIYYWEDDGVQFRDPDYEGGANTFSLRQCQQNFLEFGACDERCRSFVETLGVTDIKDPDWLPLPATGDGPVSSRRAASSVREAIPLPGSVAAGYTGNEDRDL